MSFDKTGNIRDETVKWQHLNQFIKFIDTENAVRVVLLFYCDRWKFSLTAGFVIFLFMVTGRRITFICSADLSLPLVSGHLIVALIRFTSQLLKFSSVNTTIIESFSGKCQGGGLHHYTISQKMDIIFHINTTWQAPQ